MNKSREVSQLSLWQEDHPVVTAQASTWNNLVHEMFRGELAAKEAYAKAFRSYELTSLDSERLLKIYEDHESASRFWESRSIEDGQPLIHSSGGWGLIVDRILSMAQKLSFRATLTGLIAGEQMGRSRYLFLLDQEAVPMEVKERVVNFFVPNQTEHIRLLKGLASLQPNFKQAN